MFDRKKNTKILRKEVILQKNPIAEIFNHGKLRRLVLKRREKKIFLTCLNSAFFAQIREIFPLWQVQTLIVFFKVNVVIISVKY